MSNKSCAVSPPLGHSAPRQLSGEGNDSRETCHSPFEATGETEGGVERKGGRNDLGSLETLVPFHVRNHQPLQ